MPIFGDFPGLEERESLRRLELEQKMMDLELRIMQFHVPVQPRINPTPPPPKDIKDITIDKLRMKVDSLRDTISEQQDKLEILESNYKTLTNQLKVLAIKINQTEQNKLKL